MSLTTIVALLQSALLLLTAVQSGANLPQSFRDNATAVAQQAISEATLALSSSPSATNSVATSATTTNQYFTLPNGVVVDPLGNVISAAPTTNTQAATATPAPSATPAQTSNAPLILSIALGQTSVATSSAYISWTTSIPASSKVFIAPSSNTNSPQVLQSVAGYSTEGFVNIPNLNPNTQYAYIIEATNGAQDQKIAGGLSTLAPAPITSTCDTTPPVLTVQKLEGGVTDGNDIGGGFGPPWAPMIETFQLKGFLSDGGSEVPFNAPPATAVCGEPIGLAWHIQFTQPAWEGTGTPAPDEWVVESIQNFLGERMFAAFPGQYTEQFSAYTVDGKYRTATTSISFETSSSTIRGLPGMISQ